MASSRPASTAVLGAMVHLLVDDGESRLAAVRTTVTARIE
jgi:hypothetical protein